MYAQGGNFENNTFASGEERERREKRGGTFDELNVEKRAVQGVSDELDIKKRHDEGVINDELSVEKRGGVSDENEEDEEEE